MKEKFSLAGWFKNISIAKKLYFTVGIMALLIAVELFTLMFSIHTLSSVRAYVAGEGLWSKSQKDAIYQLLKYGISRNEEDYTGFKEYIKVPLGDGKTLAELGKPNPDFEIARLGFIQGRNHPDDVNGMIKLFTRFNRISYINKAITIWAKANPIPYQLIAIGDSLHQEINSAQPSQEKINQLLKQITPINKNVTILEDDFSFTLGEGARWLEGLVLKLLFIIALTVEITGLLLAISVSRGIQKGLDEILRVSKLIGKGDFKTKAQVFSQDEIGQVAQSFNLISKEFQSSIKVLESAQNKFKELLESSPDAMVIVNSKGKIVRVNSETEKLFGYNREELKGNTVEMLIPERFSHHHMANRENYIAAPKVREMGAGLQLFGKRKDGSEFPVEIKLSPIQTEEGIWVSSSIRDITRRKNAESELKKYTHDLEVKNAELEQFAYVASHDLQEPLRSISGFVDLLDKQHGQTFNATEKQYMGYIVESTHRMKNQIKALLDYSRIGRNPVLQKVDCNELLKETLDDLNASIREKNAIIEIKTLPVLSAYPLELKLLFLNLVGNALKFANKGVPPLIKIAAQRTEIGWKFTVSDNGIGIDKKYHEKIFVIFQRLHNRKEYEGTGIGLAHCKKIVELHNGTIGVESEENKGSTFYFTLPV